MVVRVDNIHYLRGICSLLVVFTHFHFLIFNYVNGSFGVDFFFIISGFVMQGTLSRYSESTSCLRISLHFILRRLLRIYPVFLLLLIPLLIYQNTGFYESLVSVLFLNNYLNIEFPIFSSWSLVYEFNFYFFIFLMILLKKVKFIKFFLLFSGLIGLFFDFNNILIDYLLSPFNIYFAVGMYLYSNSIHLNKYFIFLCFILLFFFSLGLDSTDIYVGLPKESVNFLNLDLNFSFPRLIVWGIPVIFIFNYLLRTKLDFLNENAKKILEFFGDISYSLYLVHTVIYSLYYSFITKNYFLDNILNKLIFISISILISHLVYKYFELILSNFSKRITKKII